MANELSKYAIVTPIANEKEFIVDFVNTLRSLPGDFVWIAVFDNASKDGTFEIVQQISIKYSFIKILHLGNSNLAQCYLSGLFYAKKLGFEKIIEVDIGHPVCQIFYIVNALDVFDVVCSSRYVKGATFKAPIYRKIISICGTAISKIVLGIPFSDATGGFQGFRSSVLDSVPRKFLSTGHMYQTEMKYYCRKFLFCEIPISYNQNKSTLHFKEIIKALKIVVQLFLNHNSLPRA